MGAMNYPQPPQPEAEAPRPPLATTTVRGMILAFVALLTTIFAKHLPPQLAAPETQQLIVDLGMALTGFGVTVSAYGARRAIGGWLLLALLLPLAGCCSHPGRAELAQVNLGGLAQIRPAFDGTEPAAPSPEEEAARKQRRMRLVNQLIATNEAGSR